MPVRTCETCRHWAQHGPQEGECRRHAPLPTPWHNSYWATTRNDDWCGQWKQASDQ